MAEEDIVLEELDTASPDADLVKEFLAEHDPEVNTQETVAEPEEPESYTPPKITKVDVTDTAFRANLMADTTFDQVEAEAITRTYMAPIKDTEIPITDNDQALYLKSVLNDVPLELTQTLAGGNVSVTCRALSVYEQDLVLEAALKLVGKQEEGAFSLLPSIAQQLRAAMQVTRINDVAQNALYLEPKRGEEHEAQVDELIRHTDKYVGRMQFAKFGFLVRALNVFEHKAAHMHAMAYNKTFWKPAEID